MLLFLNERGFFSQLQPTLLLKAALPRSPRSLGMTAPARGWPHAGHGPAPLQIPAGTGPRVGPLTFTSPTHRNSAEAGHFTHLPEFQPAFADSPCPAAGAGGRWVSE